MDYEVVRSDGVDHDFELIFDFLVSAAWTFGEDDQTAINRAEQRVSEIQSDMRDLGRVPHQGTLRPHLGEGVRNVTKGRSIFYFFLDEAHQRVHVLAVFYGGQDHETHILHRLLRGV